MKMHTNVSFKINFFIKVNSAYLIFLRNVEFNIRFRVLIRSISLQFKLNKLLSQINESMPNHEI